MLYWVRCLRIETAEILRYHIDLCSFMTGPVIKRQSFHNAFDRASIELNVNLSHTCSEQYDKVYFNETI